MVIALKRRLSQLQEQKGILEEEAQEANEKINRLEAALHEPTGGRDRNAEKLTGIVNSCGGFHRIDDKGDFSLASSLAIETLLVSYLAIIMRKTQPVTWLHVICEVLFSNVIFGVEATKTVLEEIYKKYIFMDQQRFFYHGRYFVPLTCPLQAH
jgi:hypothetical protein